LVELAANVDVGGRGVHGTTGDKTSLHKFVRITTQNFSVLAGTWFTLVGIDYEVARSIMRMC
jgi:hypothetical protein